MKKGGLIILSIIFFFLLADSVFSDEATENLQAFVVESWDNPDESPWIVRGSKFSSIIKTDSGDDVYPKMGFVNSWPSNLHRKQPEGKTLRVLGIHGKFDRRGYNYLEIIPAKKNSSGELEAREVLLPGRVKNMDIWVWGANFDYYLEAHLMDYRGINHVLNFGSFKYTGWKNLTVHIPTYIPQSVVYAPALKGLKLIKFVMWTRPSERVDDFYLYLDEFKVFTDMFESIWDGEDLANPQRVEELWSEAVKVN